jgi:hypothetical protein
MELGIKKILILLLIMSPLLLNAAKGIVVLYKSGCSYYIVEDNMGYTLLEWYGGNNPNEGDTLVGNFNTYGMKDIYNLTADSETKVWIDDYMLSKDRVLEKYYEKCD